jgi:predicted amidohydrolase
VPKSTRAVRVSTPRAAGAALPRRVVPRPASWYRGAMAASRSLGFSVALVQSGFTPADCASAEAFAAKVGALMSAAVDASPRPALVAFPELTGMWLPLLERGGDRARSIAGLALRHVGRHPAAALASLISGGSLSFAFRADWQRHLEEWISPFREAAVRHGVYVCPGSAFLPRVDRDATGPWRLLDRRLYNTSCLLSPRGRALCVTRKVRLMPEERALGIHAGLESELSPAVTELGPVGILICLDGFHEALAGRMDSAGTRILIQPSANGGPWHAARGAMDEERQWLSRGMGSLIQGRESIACGLNPMSVTRILGHADEGRSSVFVNERRLEPRRSPPEAAGYPGLAGIADAFDQERIVRAAL